MGYLDILELPTRNSLRISRAWIGPRALTSGMNQTDAIRGWLCRHSTVISPSSTYCTSIHIPRHPSLVTFYPKEKALENQNLGVEADERSNRAVLTAVEP